MNIDTFRTDLRAFMSATSMNTHRLSLLAKVEASSLYNFLKGTASLSAANLLRLHSVIYESPEKKFTTATPTTPPGGEGGAGEPETAQEGRDA